MPRRPAAQRPVSYGLAKFSPCDPQTTRMFDTYGVGAAAAMPALWLDLRSAQLDESESELAQIVAEKQLARRNRIRQYEGQPVGARTDDLAGNGETDLRGSGDKTEMHQETINVDPAILLGHRRALRQEWEHLDGYPEIPPQRRHPEVQLDERLLAPSADLVRSGAEPGRAELFQVPVGPKSTPVLKSRTCTRHLDRYLAANGDPPAFFANDARMPELGFESRRPAVLLWSGSGHAGYCPERAANT